MNIDTNGQKSAYLVSLDYVGCDEMATGRDYKRFEENGGNIETVKFGVDDVYVYDSSGRVFYAKGFKYQGATRYDYIENEETIKIVSVNKTLINDNSEAKVTIYIESKNEIDYVSIKDKNGNVIETKKPTEDVDGGYEVEILVDRNGTYEIIAKDKEGNKDTENVEISGIGSNGIKPTLTAIVTNGEYKEAEGYWLVKEKNVNIKLDSDTAQYISINSDNTEPTAWLTYAEEFEKSYYSEGEKVLYIWVKDENGLEIENPVELRIKIELEDVERPQKPVENVSGDIEISVIPGNEIWANEKKVQIHFSDWCQANGYTSMYRTYSGLSGWSRWIVSYEPDVELDVTRNGTIVEAKIEYKSRYTKEEIGPQTLTVENIDRTPPTVTKLQSETLANGEHIIRGSAKENQGESGLHNEGAYFISTQQINFKYITNIDDYPWQEANDGSDYYIKIETDAKYYFYARDNANNVGMGTINAEAVDSIAPRITSITSTPVATYADLKVIAEDNAGIKEYAITIDDSTTEPTTWLSCEETKRLEITRNNLTEEGVYTVWVKDLSGNIGKASVVVKTYKAPQLDMTYPQDIYVKEGSEASFEVKFIKAGEPEEYVYQWQVSKDNGATWEDIVGAKYRIHSFTADDEYDNYLYRCIVKHVSGNVQTNGAKLEVAVISKTPPAMSITQEKEMIAGGVVINKGATKTDAPKLSLDIIAINAVQMSISETETQETWEPYTETKEYMLKDAMQGMKTINVWIKDSEGNTKKMSAEIKYVGKEIYDS